MERRKFLIGAGSAAVGSSAIIGSGAFSMVTAGRSFDVTVADDAEAYLGLDASTSDYAEEVDGTLEISFTDNGQGSGLNDDANTQINDVFKIINQGTEPITVKINNHESSWPFVAYHSDKARDNNNAYSNVDIFDTFPAHPYSGESWWEPSYASPETLSLDVGDDAFVSFEIFLSDSDTIPNSMDQSESGFPDELNFYADSSNV